MKIYSPNKQYTGESASVMFVNGVGETSNPHLIDWFRSRGYKVEDTEKKVPEKPAEPPKEEAPKQEEHPKVNPQKPVTNAPKK